MLKPSHTVSPARSQLLSARAWQNRRFPSGPEAALWRELSGGKVGVVFRRQVVLGSAIVDFFAPAVRLVVEVDGAQHRRRRTADARRDRELRRLGCVVLRIEAQVVMRELPRAVELVRAAAGRLQP
jgi:very-short-patch-repair endonuclease